MGKKSRRPGKHSQQQQQSTGTSTAGGAATTTADEAVSYPSDGPSQDELNCLQTSSTSLQAKLDQLTDLALANDRANFVSQFVPHDLSPTDTAGYLADLTTAPEAEGQWANLASEIAAIAAGKGVDKIEGDQVRNAVFYCKHPILQACDREVSFVCVNGEWRAEG